MSQSPRFNYIVTIHNKEDLIEKVLMCVLMCCRDNSHIYPVLDGCTDRTEVIIDEIIQKFADVPITKVYTSDVHELLSINAGLRAANQDGDGFNIILQDDVLLADFLLEKKVKALYDWVGPQLGYVSFRFGANFTRDAATSSMPIPLTDWAESAYGFPQSDATVVMPGSLAYRTAAIKSPVCMPFTLLRSVGLLEERLAPHSHDDTEFAIRCFKAGYRNAVFPICFYSDLKWGGTRRTPHPQIARLTVRNMDKIREWHSSTLAEICEGLQPTEVVQIPGMDALKEKEHALEVLERNCSQMLAYNKSNYYVALKSILKRVLRRIEI